MNPEAPVTRTIMILRSKIGARSDGLLVQAITLRLSRLESLESPQELHVVGENPGELDGAIVPGLRAQEPGMVERIIDAHLPELRPDAHDQGAHGVDLLEPSQQLPPAEGEE